MSRQNDLMLDYIDVAARIVEFRTKHPEGSLQQVALDFREFADKCWVVYTAAAYRTPDDMRPGIGTAWEQVPGKTNFTRDSELQNAETAAWGRAIVAAMAADTSRAIASAEEVRNRRAADEPAHQPQEQRQTNHLNLAKREVRDAWASSHEGEWDQEAMAKEFEQFAAVPIAEGTVEQFRGFAAHLRGE